MHVIIFCGMLEMSKDMSLTHHGYVAVGLICLLLPLCLFLSCNRKEHRKSLIPRFSTAEAMLCHSCPCHQPQSFQVHARHPHEQPLVRANCPGSAAR